LFFQRLDARTPLKSYMKPIPRNEIASKTPGKFLAKTPANIRGTLAKKTPTVSRFNSFITPGSKKSLAVTSTVNRYSEMPRSKNNINNTINAKESIDNNTFSIMNVSTSTEIDAPISTSSSSLTSLNNQNIVQLQTPTQSFSPLMRQIEATIERKLSTFMETIRNQSIQSNNASRNSLKPSPKKSETNLIPESVATQFQFDVKNAVMNGLREMQDMSGFESVDNDFDTDDIENNSQAACSTASRAIPPRMFLNDVPLNDSNKENQNHRRINRRLSVIDSPVRYFGRERKIRALSGEEQEEEEVIIMENEKEERVIDEKATKVINPPRRSMRICQMKEIRANKDNKNFKLTDRVAPTIKRQTFKNEIVAAYLSGTSGEIKNISKKDHKNAIMHVFNTGTLKNLQILPGIGQKSAYLIVTHRAVKGKFSSFEEIKKVLMMSEKKWQKFLEVISRKFY
jgi:DNA uptake protein ComE-like DNA-binding protein